ncbi:cyclopropane-fatty-acyl-phospholipid synthase family protein [Rhodococcus sp. F64268]|uniref:SAM-dependent methyltransferase n=1 Tax=Rhodococcus sp. F64268 TaxID=2926402 RepID=UPI001FF2B060|nr:cyclopropane-fatty-acyl-phospholipid synthase family protein [Rhodococcus sp. F64268]MCK0089640.1 cyclopropane-fatty-acyl-phospholipid synthase family protein [Rhodococcus sp. F64268]
MSAARDLLATFEEFLRVQIPVHVRCWDGSEAGPPDAEARVEFRNRRALRRVLWAPNELGLSRAYVSGDLVVDGDLYAVLGLPDLVDRLGSRTLRDTSPREFARLARKFAALGIIGPSPRPPSVEIPRRRGALHSKRRDAQVVSHHYDVGNDFYRLFLGPSMVYSCGYWSRPETGTPGLEDAQHDKVDLVCRKLGLEPGMRLLDVGCGWGAMALHAAQHYGVDVLGVTLSAEQRDFAQARIAAAGMSDRIEIRLQDYRDIDETPFDAISSIGMSEHVGATKLPTYAQHLHELLVPGGRLLNHAIASVVHRPDSRSRPATFIDRYVFPDGEILPLSRTLDAFERAGLEVRDVEALREHYALTLRAWVANLQESWEEASSLVGAERARTWLLYLTASALGFEEPGRLTINQVLAVRPTSTGASNMPRTRHEWLSSG